MSIRTKKNFNQFYLDMLNLIEKHGENIPPHEIGFALICNATFMMLQHGDAFIALKTANAGILGGIEEFNEENLND